MRRANIEQLQKLSQSIQSRPISDSPRSDVVWFSNVMSIHLNVTSSIHQRASLRSRLPSRHRLLDSALMWALFNQQLLRLCCWHFLIMCNWYLKHSILSFLSLINMTLTDMSDDHTLACDLIRFANRKQSTNRAGRPSALLYMTKYNRLFSYVMIVKHNMVDYHRIVPPWKPK